MYKRQGETYAPYVNLHCVVLAGWDGDTCTCLLYTSRITHVILIDLGVQKVHLVQRHVRVLKHSLLEFVLGTALKYGIHQVCLLYTSRCV